jgi:hypothetical protein
MLSYTRARLAIGPLFVVLALALVLAPASLGLLRPPALVAEEPKPVLVTNEPTVKAEQQGPWTVSLSGPVTLSSGGSVGIDPAQNVVRLTAPQPAQASSPLFIDYPDSSWTWTTAVPAGKRLAVELVSGHFSKRIASSNESNASPLLLTLTTTSAGQTVPHVVPIKTGYIIDGVIAYHDVSHALTVYADAGTNVSVTLQHLFSPGYQYEGRMSFSGRLYEVP